MESRMERYASKEETKITSRTMKNKKMYEDLYQKATVTDFKSVASNVIDLSDSSIKGSSRRENYQKSKGRTGLGIEEERGIKEYNYEYPRIEKEPRNFDINQVLKEAKKNRDDYDELEKRRKLRTPEYNILADLNEEKLKEYRKNKKEVLSLDEEKNLEELIHTITSKTMVQDIEKVLDKEKEKDSLLDDLMPTALEETVISSDILEELKNNPVVEKKEDNEEESKIVLDESFYTKSMDLSKEDLILEEDEEEELFEEEKGLPTWAKVIITAVVLSLIIVIGFVVYQYVI